MARVWRRRRSLDTPRPAGRRWWRIRRGGSRATQLIARVALRPRQRMTNAARLVAPVSPAVGPSRLAVSTTVAAPEIWTEPARSAPALRRVPAHSRRRAGHSAIPTPPDDWTPALRAKFAIVNGCTIGSVVMGLVAVFLALSGDPTSLRLAAGALLVCVVLDGCDGALARRFGVSSPFGCQLDSLADLSSFGVATGLVTYQWLIGLGAPRGTAAIVCVLIVVCAAIRLARFNVSPKNGHHFSGVPTTMVAAVLALNILVGPQSVPVMAQAAFAGVYALAMVTSFPYVKLARVLHLPAWLWVVPAICLMVSVPGTFVAVVGGYLVSGPILWLLHRRDRDPHPDRDPRPALV